MMDLLPPALNRMREYRRTLGENETIDQVGGFSSGDIDIILGWFDREAPAPLAATADRTPYPLRAAGRVAVLVAIMLILVFIWRSLGS